MGPSAAGTDAGPRRGAVVALVAGSVLTVLAAAPVLRAPQQRLFGAELVGRHHDPFTVIEQFRRPPAAGPYTQPAVDWVGAALAPLVGAVPAYNLLVLASFPLSALTAYLLALHVTGERGPALVAGLAYAFSTFHVAQAAYHVHVAQTQWLPLYLLALWRALDAPTPRRLLALAGAAAVTVLASFYAGLVAALLTPPALLGYAWAWRSRPAAVLRTALALLLPAAGAGLAALALRAGGFGAGAAFAFPRSDLFQFGARWWSFLLPAAEHPLFGSWARGVWARNGVGDGLLEQQVGLGLCWLGLAALAPLAARPQERSRAWRWTALLSGLAAWAALCALSPEGTLFGFVWRRPSHFLYELLPMFRAYARCAQAAGLAVALLAALGLSLLWRRSRSCRTLAAGLVVLGALELLPAPPWRWRDVLPTRAHRLVAQMPATVRLIDCAPAGRVEEASLPQLLGRPLAQLGGPVPDCGEPGLAGKLAALGFTHLLRRAAAPGGPLAEEGLELLAREADSSLYRVVAAVPAVYASELAGFGPRESGPGDTWRFMGASGSLLLVNTTSARLRASLELELEPWPAGRAVELRLGGANPVRLDLPGGRSWQRLEGLSLPPGTSELALTALAPPVRADDVLHNGDPRRLALALHGWRVGASPEPREAALTSGDPGP